MRICQFSNIENTFQGKMKERECYLSTAPTRASLNHREAMILASLTILQQIKATYITPLTGWNIKAPQMGKIGTTNKAECRASASSQDSAKGTVQKGALLLRPTNNPVSGIFPGVLYEIQCRAVLSTLSK